MSQSFRNIFESDCPAQRERSKFLSRVFGVFSEKIVGIWAEHEHSQYENLGRPTIKSDGNGRGYTLDFTLKDRASSKIYVTEMKCEIEYQNFKYFVLDRSSQLDHHKKPAFDAFLRAAKLMADQEIHVGGKKIDTNGTILIWGAITPEGREQVIEAKGLHDVMSVEEICADLVAWECVRYAELVDQRREWCSRLFTGLLEARTS
ncbi:MAG: hypothetical protein GXP05_08340 [Alphaproteobacteria bacterium]|nr:hypothetical protein [Alphaproteobacteria bacterium]